MPRRPATHRPHGTRQQTRKPDTRPSARQRGYTTQWEKYRKWFLSQPENVLCRWPGCRSVATVVDHIEPHKGDMRKFWDEANLQPLCAYHHNVKTAREDGGFGNQRKER